MGYLVSAHLTRRNPDSSKLRAVLPPSIGFRVYRHATLPLFAIDTFGSAKPSRHPFGATTPSADLPLELPDALAGLRAIHQQLREQGSADGLKRAYVNLSMLLSASLQQDVVTVYTDDDGNDFACLARQGAISTLVARCEESVVRFDRQSDATLSPAADDHELHALAGNLLQESFGISGQELGLGSFDPPENLGFVELPGR